MGREILYCHTCGKQLNADDFTRGRAHTFENRQYCRTCLPAKHDPAKPPPPRAGKRAPSTVRLQPVQPSPKRSPLPWILGGAAAFAAVLAVVLLRPEPPPPEDPSKKILEEARAFAKANAKSPEDVAKRWEQAVAATNGHPEAKRELDRSLRARSDAESADLKELDAKVAERRTAGQFGPAKDVLEEARKRRESADWAKSVEARIAELRAATDRLYPELKAAAVAARAKGDDAELAAQKARLALWGRKDFETDLDAELAKVVPREPLPAGASLLLRWPQLVEGQRFNPHGSLKDGGLLAPAYGQGAVMSGFEVLKPPFEIPERGEFWLTYATTSPKEFILRFRIIAGDKTLPYNWTVAKPEVGRPARVKAPLRQFMNYDHRLVAPGDRVHSIYFQVDDPKAEFVVLEAQIFKLP